MLYVSTMHHYAVQHRATCGTCSGRRVLPFRIKSPSALGIGATQSDFLRWHNCDGWRSHCCTVRPRHPSCEKGTHVETAHICPVNGSQAWTWP